MGYKTVVDTLILQELRERANDFAAHYRPGRPTVVLVPGGMGSRLYKTIEPFRTGVPFPEQPVAQKIWLSFAAVLYGDLLGLRMTRNGKDRGDRPVIASGEVSSEFAKKYDDTQAYFAGPDPTFPANYAVFGYDWRKLPRSGAVYLKRFLQFLREAVAERESGDTKLNITLLGHSFGGLVIKLFLNDLVDRGENPDDWLERFISVGSPFYGTENHLQRYYKGVKYINFFTPGGRDAITDLVWTLPDLTRSCRHRERY